MREWRQAADAHIVAEDQKLWKSTIARMPRFREETIQNAHARFLAEREMKKKSERQYERISK